MKNTCYVLSFLLMMLGCSGCNSSLPQVHYQQPLGLNDGLAVGTLEEVGLDSSKIMAAESRIRAGKHGEVHSILLHKNGKLVFEEYFYGHTYKWSAPGYHGEMVQWDKEKLHPIMSCTKSFTSACIGIAVDKGQIESVHQSIFDYLPDHQQFRVGGKENITIEHLLTMTSGLAWNEWNAAHGTSANDIDRIYLECSDDPIKCVLERSLKHTPGDKFTYHGGGLIILGEILRNATGMNIDEYSMTHLFGPLEVDSTVWYQFDNGSIATGGSLRLSSRDMLKLGITYLNNGMWNNQRILSENWVEKSSTVYHSNKGIKIPIEDSGKNEYAYTWWMSNLPYSGGKTPMYRAGGWGGQAIMVYPELDMVVVFTGGNYSSRSTLFKIVKNHILPAAK